MSRMLLSPGRYVQGAVAIKEIGLYTPPIALGGGVSIDAGQAVAHGMKLPVIVVPTVISSEAPCSALPVICTGAAVRTADGHGTRYKQVRQQ